MSKKEGKNLKEAYPSIPFVPSCLKDEGSCENESCVLFLFFNKLFKWLGFFPTPFIGHNVSSHNSGNVILLIGANPIIDTL